MDKRLTNSTTRHFQILPTVGKSRCKFQNHSFDLRKVYYVSEVYGDRPYGFDIFIETGNDIRGPHQLRFNFPSKGEALHAHIEFCMAYCSIVDVKVIDQDY